MYIFLTPLPPPFNVVYEWSLTELRKVFLRQVNVKAIQKMDAFASINFHFQGKPAKILGKNLIYFN